MFALSRLRALLFGMALIVLTNAVVLAGVAYNRSGEPEAVLKLSERELQIDHWRWPANENSSIDVYLSWRVAQAKLDDNIFYGITDRSLPWLEPAKLREWGFHVEGDLESQEVAERVYRQPSRRAWFVLELDGPAYRAAVEEARQELERAAARVTVDTSDQKFQDSLNAARQMLNRQERFASRLFVIDAGVDEDALRAGYSDRQRYVILPGRIDVTITGQPGRKRLLARIVELDVRTIRVPHQYRGLVEPLVDSREFHAFASEREPRFAATVHFGRRFEPWIADLSLLE